MELPATTACLQRTIRYACFYVSLDAFPDASVGKVYYRVPWTLQHTQLAMAWADLARTCCTLNRTARIEHRFRTVLIPINV